MIAEVGDSISRIPGPPRGPFIANDDDVAFLDAAGKNCGERIFFAIEHASLAGERLAFLAADLRDGAVWSEVATKDHEVAVFFDRVI